MIDNKDPATSALVLGDDTDVRTLSRNEYLKRRKKLLADHEREQWRARDAADLAIISSKYAKQGE